MAGSGADEVREEGRFQGMVLERLDTAVSGIAALNAKVDSLTGSRDDHEYRIRMLEQSSKQSLANRRFFWTGLVGMVVAAAAVAKVLLGIK